MRTSDWLREHGQSTTGILPYQDLDTAEVNGGEVGAVDAALTAAERKMYQMPDKRNPFGNILLTDAPDRPPAPPAFLPEVQDQILQKSKEMIADMRGDTVDRLFGSVDDALALEHSQRQFYTTAVTTTPSDIRVFAEFCYGNTGAFRDSMGKRDAPTQASS